MTTEALAMWGRALDDLRAAEALVSMSFPDAAASRAYYAVFNAVSALFSAGNRTFKKHSGVETAMHRDLVHSGRWPTSHGADYGFLRNLRSTGDYGAVNHVSEDEARLAIDATKRLLGAVSEEMPELFDISEIATE